MVMENGTDGQQCTKLILEDLEQKKLLKKVGHTWALPAHSVTISPQLQNHIRTVEAFLEESGMKTPVLAELESYAQKKGIDEKTLKQILRHLVGSRSVYSIEGSYIHRGIVDPCRTKLLKALTENPMGLTVAQFRDLVDGNRKICLLLYALFDSEGITSREGDVRIITSKGTALVETGHSGLPTAGGRQ